MNLLLFRIFKHALLLRSLEKHLKNPKFWECHIEVYQTRYAILKEKIEKDGGSTTFFGENLYMIEIINSMINFLKNNQDETNKSNLIYDYLRDIVLEMEK